MCEISYLRNILLIKRRSKILFITSRLLIKQSLRPVISEIYSIITAITCRILAPHSLELLRSLVVARYCNIIEFPNLSKLLLKFTATILRSEKRAVNRYSGFRNFNRIPTACFLFIFIFFSPRSDCF